MAYERDGERYGMSREPRIITITSTEKLLLYGYKDLLQPIVSFAKPRHVRLVCLDPPGSSIDAILLGLPHTQIGVPSSTRR